MTKLQFFGAAAISVGAVRNLPRSHKPVIDEPRFFMLSFIIPTPIWALDRLGQPPDALAMVPLRSGGGRDDEDENESRRVRARR